MSAVCGVGGTIWSPGNRDECLKKAAGHSGANYRIVLCILRRLKEAQLILRARRSDHNPVIGSGQA
jgi:hypothetical protein